MMRDLQPARIRQNATVRPVLPVSAGLRASQVVQPIRTSGNGSQGRTAPKLVSGRRAGPNRPPSIRNIRNLERKTMPTTTTKPDLRRAGQTARRQAAHPAGKGATR